MKKNISYKIRLGLFISLGIVAFILGIYFVGERQQLFRSTIHISGVFKDVAGLQAGGNVRFSGINIGTVEKISIVSDSSVKVAILIDQGVCKFIKKDALASIGSEGLIGNKILIITPGIGGKMEIANDDILETVTPVNMDEILISLKKTIDNTSKIAGDLSKITNTLQSGKGTIGRLLMDESMALNFDSAIVNLKQGSLQLKTLMESAKISFAQNFDSTFVNMKEGSEGFKKLMTKAKDSWLLWGF